MFTLKPPVLVVVGRPDNTPVVVLKDGKLAFVFGSPGGETIGQTEFQVLVNLIDFKLPELGENVTDRSEALAVLEHYRDVIARLPATGLDTEVSVKLTQLGLDLDPELAVTSTIELAQKSAAIGRRLWIDMEASPYVERTLDVYRRVIAREKLVGVCLQAYLHRTAADLESLIPLGCAIRMVKGAYQEPPDIALAAE